MILCDRDLHTLGPELLDPFEPEMMNPASIDIRIGNMMLRERETQDGNRAWIRDSLDFGIRKVLYPGEFVLVETFETLKVPNGYAIEMKLKSSRAREGYNHSLAFWFDPGWVGRGTMELYNVSRYANIPLYNGLRIAQIIVHRLSGDAIKPYQGKYQGAIGVEKSKE